MNIVKMTRNGQVTIPANMRRGLQTAYYICEISESGVLFKPVDLEKTKTKKVMFGMKDLKNWTFESKNPKEKNLAKKIDQILY